MVSIFLGTNVLKQKDRRKKESEGERKWKRNKQTKKGKEKKTNYVGFCS